MESVRASCSPVTEENVTRIVIALIAAVPSMVMLLKISNVKQDVKTVKHEINSRMTELLELTRKSSHAEGVKDGRSSKKKGEK